MCAALCACPWGRWRQGRKQQIRPPTVTSSPLCFPSGSYVKVWAVRENPDLQETTTQSFSHACGAIAHAQLQSTQSCSATSNFSMRALLACPCGVHGASCSRPKHSSCTSCDLKQKVCASLPCEVCLSSWGIKSTSASSSLASLASAAGPACCIKHNCKVLRVSDILYRSRNRIPV